MSHFVSPQNKLQIAATSSKSNQREVRRCDVALLMFTHKVPYIDSNYNRLAKKYQLPIMAAVCTRYTVSSGYHLCVRACMRAFVHLCACCCQVMYLNLMYSQVVRLMSFGHPVRCQVHYLRGCICLRHPAALTRSCSSKLLLHHSPVSVHL